MAKRFTDNEKWADPWFCSLRPCQKLFWLYVLDSCDIAGYWKVNLPLAEFHIGSKVNDDLLYPFTDRITKVNEELWFINKFILFQQGVDIENLNPNNNTHKGIMKRLESQPIENKESSPLQGASIDLQRSPSNGNGKGKILNNTIFISETKKDKKERSKFQKPTISDIREYCVDKAKSEPLFAQINAPQFWNYYETRGWMIGKNKIKDWKACVRTWVIRMKNEG